MRRLRTFSVWLNCAATATFKQTRLSLGLHFFVCCLIFRNFCSHICIVHSVKRLKHLLGLLLARRQSHNNWCNWNNTNKLLAHAHTSPINCYCQLVLVGGCRRRQRPSSSTSCCLKRTLEHVKVLHKICCFHVNSKQFDVIFVKICVFIKVVLPPGHCHCQFVGARTED